MLFTGQYQTDSPGDVGEIPSAQKQQGYSGSGISVKPGSPYGPVFPGGLDNSKIYENHEEPGDSEILEYLNSTGKPDGLLNPSISGSSDQRRDTPERCGGTQGNTCVNGMASCISGKCVCNGPYVRGHGAFNCYEKGMSEIFVRKIIMFIFPRHLD